MMKKSYNNLFLFFINEETDSLTYKGQIQWGMSGR